MTAENLKFKITNQKGAAAVEFAIVLPLLLIFIFGVIEFGLLLYNKQIITNAVREGARRGVIMRPAPRDVLVENNEIEQRIHNYADSHLVTFGPGSLSVVSIDDTRNVVPPIKNNTRDISFGADLVVEAEFDYTFLFLSIKIWPFNGIGPIKLSSVSTMKME